MSKARVSFLLFGRSDIPGAIDYFEAGLKSIEATPYHDVLGKSFLHLTETASRYLIDFFLTIRAQQLAAIYFK